jgi:hypothetical protein
MGIAADTFISVWRGTAWKLKLWGRGIRQLLSTSNGPVSITESLILQVVRAAVGGGTVGTAIVGTAIVGNIFSDGLENIDMDATVTAQGAGWDRIGSTTISIVRDDQFAVANDSGLITPNGPVTGLEWESSPMAPETGSHALRTRFAGTAAGQDAWSEMRFKLGTFEPPEVWLSFDVRIPINHFHRGVLDNNKLLRLFGSAYGSGGKCGMEFRPTSDGSGGSNMYIMADSNGNAMSAPIADSVPFARVPEDRGRWQRLIFHAVSETSPGASDGIVELWRRWEDEATFTKMSENLSVALQRGDGTVAGFNKGYLMGYANSGYTDDTEFLLDNFNIGTESMI